MSKLSRNYNQAVNSFFASLFIFLALFLFSQDLIEGGYFFRKLSNTEFLKFHFTVFLLLFLIHLVNTIFTASSTKNHNSRILEKILDWRRRNFILTMMCLISGILVNYLMYFLGLSSVYMMVTISCVGLSYLFTLTLKYNVANKV